MQKATTKMLQKIAHNPYAMWIIAIVYCSGLALIFTVFSQRSAIIILNGIYFGSIVGILATYWQLMIATLIGKPPFDRAREYALGVFFIWGAYSISVAISVFNYSSNYSPPIYMLVLVSRYTAIIGAWLQVTAPDFGEGFLGSTDRKILWSAVTISALVSIAVIVAQSQAVLAE